MAKINLLPWRQELRKKRQQEFLVINVAVAGLALALVVFGHTFFSKQVSDQEERNAYIKNEISSLDKQITEIDELQKRRDELLARMKVIQDLQGHRPVIVRVFDELVRALPDGVYFKTLERTGDLFRIQGVAQSNNQVSNLMRNLDASPWFKKPALSKVEADKNAADSGGKNADAEKAVGNQFILTVELEAPETATDKNNEKKEAAK